MKFKRRVRKYIRILYRCSKKAAIDTVNHDGIEHAGYLSFLSILSFFPFLVLFVSLAGMFGQTDLGSEFVKLLIRNVPDGVGDALLPRIDEIINGPPQSLLTIAIVGAIWTASSSVEGIRTILNRAYRVSTPPAYILRRLLSILQFLIITVMIISAMLFFLFAPIALEYFINLLSLQRDLIINPAFVKLRYLLSIFIWFGAVCFLYYIIPNIKQRWWNVIPGAVYVVLLWLLTAFIFSFYIRSFDQVNIIYGSLAGIIVALLFFYLLAMIFMFGAEFNYALDKHLGFKIEEKEKVNVDETKR
jgi:membrane protein